MKSVIILTICSFVVCGLLYPLSIIGIGKLMPEASGGYPMYEQGRLVGYRSIGQPFSNPGYFWGRPSAVNYDASATGGSNLSNDNPDYLHLVEARIDTLLKHHPGSTKADIPLDLITASGSGLDPHISLNAAIFQVRRIAEARHLPVETVEELIHANTQGAWLGLFGPKDMVNVFSLNLALDRLGS